MVEEAVEHGADGGRIAEQLAPVFHGAVRGHQRAGPFVAPHNNLQEFFGGGQGQLAHAEVIDDEQRHGDQGLREAFALAVEGCFGEIIEQRVRFAVEDAITLLDGRLAEGLAR